MSSRNAFGRPLLRCLVASLALAALACAACAAQYVVTPSGSDTNSGAPGSPFRTIGRGLFQLKPGDTLIIGPGSYRESCTLSVKGAAETPVVIRGVASSDSVLPTIEASGDDGLSINDSAYVTVQGLTVTGAARAGIAVTRSDRITISASAMTDNAGYGVYASLSDHVEVKSCEITGTKEGDAVYMYATEHPTVTDCGKIRGNAGCGVRLSADAAQGDGLITGATVARNIINDNGRLGGAAISLEGVEKSTIENNVCDRNLAGGILSFKGAAARAGSRNKFTMNVVRFAPGVGQFGIKLVDGSTNSSLEQNTLAVENGPAVVVDAASAKGFRASFDFYVTTGPPVSFSYKGETLDFASWQAATGQDADAHVAVTKPEDENPPASGAPSADAPGAPGE